MDSLLVDIIGFIVAVAVFLAILRLFSIENSLKQIAANLGEVSADLSWLKEAKAAELRRPKEPPTPALR